MNCAVKNYIKVDHRSHRRNRFSSRAKSKDRDGKETLFFRVLLKLIYHVVVVSSLIIVNKGKKGKKEKRNKGKVAYI